MAIGLGDWWETKETVVALVRGCPIAGCFAHFLGRSAHLYHDFIHFSSARHTHRACRDSGGYWNAVGFWGGAPNTHTSLPYLPARVFLDTWDEGFWTAQCQKILFGFGGGAQNIPLYPIGQQRCFWNMGWGCLNCTMPKTIVWVVGWRPKHPYHCAL